MMRKPVAMISLIGVMTLGACQEPYGGRQEGPSSYPGPPATTPKPPAKAPIEEAKEVVMTSAQLREKLTGLEMYGCYPNDAPFALKHREDGGLIDLQQGAGVVGSWHVENDQICYDYTAGPAAGQGRCYTARQKGGHMHFYSGERFIASTMCPFPKPVAR